MTISEAYKILEISENSSEEEIKTAYKKLAKKYHPDFYRNNPLASLAEEKLKEINEAYEIIQKKSKNNTNNYSKGKETLWKFTYLENGKLFAFNTEFKGYTGEHIEKSKIYTKIGNYKEGLKDGLWTTYSTQNGKKIYTEYFKNGVLNGECCTFFTLSPIVLKRENYKDGLKHGEQKNFNPSEEDESKAVLEYLSEWKYGKEVKRIKYSEGKEKIEVWEKDNTIRFEEKNIFYVQEELKSGTGVLIYENGMKEEVFFKKGCISFFSTKYLLNNKIEKEFYYLGMKRNKNFLRCLSKIEFKDIINIPYIENYKFYMTEHEYMFYKNINLLKSINIAMLFRLQGTGSFEDKIAEWYDKITETLISNVDKIEFDEGNYRDYENNKDTFINYEEIKEIYPEGFIPKFRKRSIEIGMDNIIERFYSSVDSSRNIATTFEKAQREVIELFIDVFYRDSSRNYEFTYDTELNGGDLVSDKYWTDIFFSIKDKDNIPDSLILFLNLLLRGKLDLSLINLFFALKYGMIQFINEEIERIKENLKNKKWFNNYFSKEILNRVFGFKNIDNVEDLIFYLEYLLSGKKIDVENGKNDIPQLKNLYEEFKIFILEITNNKLFTSYKEETKRLNNELQLFNSKILSLEREVAENKKQEIDSKIEKCKKLSSEFKMKYTEMDIDRDKNEFEKMETNIRFLSYLKSNELTRDQIEKLSQLKKIKDLATHKITVYGKELDKMPKEREDIKNDRMFTPIVCLGGAIAGVYFIFKHFSGLITMIAIPIVFTIASGIISSVKQETDKKEKELNLKQKKINSIINVAHRIDKILSPFIKI